MSKEKEMKKLEEQFDKFDESVKALTLDRMNEAPKAEVEAQTKMSQKEINDSKDIYLKPHKTISSPQKFNDKFKADYEHQKEYVRFIAENKEVVGETIDLWTRPFGGMNAEEWLVPVNKPVWGPRYLAEQIAKCTYHRLVMVDKPTEQTGMGTMYGQMIADEVRNRLDARPAAKKSSVFV